MTGLFVIEGTNKRDCEVMAEGGPGLARSPRLASSTFGGQWDGLSACSIM
jgi:hypothetical protein